MRKKYIFIVSSLVMLLAISGCSNKNKWDSVEPDGTIYVNPDDTQSFSPKTQEEYTEIETPETPLDKEITNITSVKESDDIVLVSNQCNYVGRTNSVVFTGAIHGRDKESKQKLTIKLFSKSDIVSTGSITVSVDLEKPNMFALEAFLPQGVSIESITSVEISSEPVD